MIHSRAEQWADSADIPGPDDEPAKMFAVHSYAPAISAGSAADGSMGDLSEISSHSRSVPRGCPRVPRGSGRGPKWEQRGSLSPGRPATGLLVKCWYQKCDREICTAGGCDLTSSFSRRESYTQVGSAPVRPLTSLSQFNRFLQGTNCRRSGQKLDSILVAALVTWGRGSALSARSSLR